MVQSRIPAHRVRRRPPPFHPVAVRARKGGWSFERQRRFLAALYWTGSVASAARAVGMSRMSAYRLRRRAGAASFAHAWDTVLTPPGSGRCVAPRADWRKATCTTALGKCEFNSAGFALISQPSSRP